MSVGVYVCVFNWLGMGGLEGGVRVSCTFLMACGCMECMHARVWNEWV